MYIHKRLISGSIFVSILAGSAMAQEMRARDDNPVTPVPIASAPVVTVNASARLHTKKDVEFADGSRVNSKDDKLVRTNTADGPTEAPNVDGTGTTGRLPKWTNGPAGTLGDSLLGESGNGVELRSPSGGVGINPMLVNPNNFAGLALLQVYPATGPNSNSSMQVVPRGTGAADNRAQISVFNTDFIANSTNYEFSSLRARGSDFVFGTGKVGTGVIRPLMFATGFLGDNTTNNGQFYLAINGNVGVGTIAPGSKLDVAGNINTSSQYNIGGSRVFSIAGTSNTFAGTNSGNSNTTGSKNSFFGNNAGQANTTGLANSFFGHRAGEANTTGTANAFFGQGAGQANTTATGNAFFGTLAGLANTTGPNNSFFGDSAGWANTTGNNNAFFGSMPAFRIRRQMETRSSDRMRASLIPRACRTLSSATELALPTQPEATMPSSVTEPEAITLLRSAAPSWAARPAPLTRQARKTLSSAASQASPTRVAPVTRSSVTAPAKLTQPVTATRFSVNPPASLTRPALTTRSSNKVPGTITCRE